MATLCVVEYRLLAWRSRGVHVDALDIEDICLLGVTAR